VARVDEIELDNEDGYPVDSVAATCSRCDHQTESYGTGDASRRRCLLMLRQTCPRRECNFYVEGQSR
jgi:hypothetical protein